MDRPHRLLLPEHPFPRQLASWRIEKGHSHRSRMHSSREPLDLRHLYHHSRTLSRLLINHPRLPHRPSSEVRKDQRDQLHLRTIIEEIGNSLSPRTILHNGHKAVDRTLRKDHPISGLKIIRFRRYRLYR